MESGDVMVGGDRPAQPRTTQPPSARHLTHPHSAPTGLTEIWKYFLLQNRNKYIQYTELSLVYCFVDSLTEEVEEETEQDFVRENLLTAFL